MGCFGPKITMPKRQLGSLMETKIPEIIQCAFLKVETCGTHFTDRNNNKNNVKIVSKKSIGGTFYFGQSLFYDVYTTSLSLSFTVLDLFFRTQKMEAF